MDDGWEIDEQSILSGYRGRKWERWVLFLMYGCCGLVFFLVVGLLVASIEVRMGLLDEYIEKLESIGSGLGGAADEAIEVVRWLAFEK